MSEVLKLYTVSTCTGSLMVVSPNEQEAVRLALYNPVIAEAVRSDEDIEINCITTQLESQGYSIAIMLNDKDVFH